MNRPTGVTVMAFIFLFMAAGVAIGLITVLSEQALKRGLLALYVAKCGQYFDPSSPLYRTAKDAKLVPLGMYRTL
jgi:hypothetical protein